MNKKGIRRLIAAVAVLVMVFTMTVSAFADYSTIPYGSRSDRVRKMQNALKKKGYYKGSVDGYFSSATKAALIKYQKHVGLTADGIAGNKTLTALYEGISKVNKMDNSKLKSSTKTQNPRSLYYGCTGARVRALQRALKKAGCYNSIIDGKYGDATMKAVKAYQYKVGLTPDGIAGTKTLSSLRKKTGVNIYGGFIIDVGSKGSEVERVKSYLGKLGYSVSSGDVFTKTDAAAVKSWQADKGLNQTGTITESVYNHTILGLN